jgi:hypothetical protein
MSIKSNMLYSVTNKMHRIKINCGTDTLEELEKWGKWVEETKQEEGLNDVTVLEVEKDKPGAGTKEDWISKERE